MENVDKIVTLMSTEIREERGNGGSCFFFFFLGHD